IEAAAGAGRATADAVDVTDPTAVESLAGRVFAEDGAVDVLHNNAGFGHAGRVEDTTLEGWQRVLGVNLMGTVHGIHFFVYAPSIASSGVAPVSGGPVTLTRASCGRDPRSGACRARKASSSGNWLRTPRSIRVGSRSSISCPRAVMRVTPRPGRVSRPVCAR
ncbi:MAG: SDR family oxidoreductase, partial [Actinomycetota bacterium]|nr:SDR family oxidoreductase [Actinomycetota bacterium]